MNKEILISPSLLSADFTRLGEDSEMIIRSAADCLHMEMMMNVHYEACTHLHRTIQEIHSTGMKAGVALNPATPLAMVEEVLYDVDLVLIMSVNPGFSGQSFITSSTDKVRRLRQMIDRLEHRPLIEVDGGVNGKTAPMLVAAGADVLVSGSYVFGAEDPEATILSLKSRD